MREGRQYKHFTVKEIEYSLPRAPCPQCGADSPRNRTYIREAVDTSLESTLILRIKVSVHKCPNKCGYFSACPPFINKGYHYTNECISKCSDSVERDKVSISQTANRVARDFNIYPAKSTVWRWLNNETTKIKVDPSYEQWVVASFSGVACVDEVYSGKFAVIFMTDPIADMLIGYVVKEGTLTQEDMKDFLLSMQKKGINVKLLITDNSTLYADDILKEVLPNAEHGLCNFHIKDNITKECLKAVKRVRDDIDKQIPKLKRGRPDKEMEEVATRANLLKDEKKEIFANRYLFVTRPENLTQEEEQKRKALEQKHPILGIIATCMILIYELFNSKTYEEAKQKHYILITSEFATNEYTKSIVAKIKSEDKFKKAFAHLLLGVNVRTTNHVERLNRAFRKIQKSCNRLRTKETIENRIDAETQISFERKGKLIINQEALLKVA